MAAPRLTPPQIDKLREGLSAQSRRTREREARERRVRDLRHQRERVKSLTVTTTSGVRMHLREAGVDAQGNQLWVQIPGSPTGESGPSMTKGASR